MRLIFAPFMVAHYLIHVFPNCFKAQVVATSREAAARYKSAIDTAIAESIKSLEQSNPLRIDIERLKRMRTDVVISGSHNDPLHLKQYTDNSKHEAIVKSFKLPFGGKDKGITGDVGILIVNNMLLTGFDAPIEQVMYLDRVIIAHNLLQAIARVNRVGYAAKEKGFVVDYVGIGHHLKKAIDTYDEKEQNEILNTLSFPEDEIRELNANYSAILALLEKHGLTDLADHDAFFDLFYDEDIRFEFILAFGALTRSLNLVFPAKEALEYIGKYQELAEINVLAGKHLRDERLSMKGIPAKLRVLTDAYLVSKGIDQGIKPISIFDEDFDREVGKRKRTKTKAAAAEHAIRHHIDVELDDDPELQASFAEALAAIFQQFKENWQKIVEELEKLRKRIIDAENEPTYGLHKKKQMPFFRMFKGELFGEGPLDDNQIAQLVDLTQQVFLVVERELQLTGFWGSVPARNKLKAEIQQVLVSQPFLKLPHVIANRAQIISRVMEIAEKNNDRILYAV